MIMHLVPQQLFMTCCITAKRDMKVEPVQLAEVTQSQMGVSKV